MNPQSIETRLLIAEGREAAQSGRGKAIRTRRMLSQREVADAIGVSAEAVSRWESGDRLPRGTAAIRYAHLLRRLDIEQTNGTIRRHNVEQPTWPPEEIGEQRGWWAREAIGLGVTRCPFNAHG